MERENQDARNTANGTESRTQGIEAFVGALRAARFASARRFGKALCKPGWQWRLSMPYSDYTLWYVIGGQGHIRIQDEETNLRRGTLVILRPGDRLYATQDDLQPLSVIYTHFYDTCRHPDVDFSVLPRFTQTDNRFFFENELHHMLSVQASEDAFADEEFDNAVKRLFIRVCRIHHTLPAEQSPSWHQASMIRNAIVRIREESGEPIDFHDLAASVHMSPQYFSRLFKQHTGESLKAFVARTKLERAMAMLQDTSLRISDISERLGYSDIYNFSKVFKVRYGVSPSYYRQSLVKGKVAHGSG